PAPVVVAPALNVNMWNHAATQQSVETPRARGVKVVDPAEGYLACGMIGAGRLAGQDDIVAAVREALKTQRDLDGETVLITAGPTCEDLDPVRYITNRSSGKMGYAVAEAAALRGAKVILVSGPVNLEVPACVERIDVRTAKEMHHAVAERIADSSIAILAAAVAQRVLHAVVRMRSVLHGTAALKRSGDCSRHGRAHLRDSPEIAVRPAELIRRSRNPTLLS